MSADLLLREFDRIAEAPNAVGEIRQFILDLAVSGRLVAQDLKDLGAADLLRRIATENGRKGADSLSIASADGFPFSVPDSWDWTFLTEICDVSYGFAFESSGFRSPGTGVPLIRIRDISSSDTEAYFEGTFDSRYLVQPGDFLVGMDGDFNVREWRGPEALLNQRVMRLSCWKHDILALWAVIPLQMILNHLHLSTSKTTVKHLSARQVRGVKVPIPSVAEQQSIVTKVDELLTLCDRLELAQRERELRRSALRTESLHRLISSGPSTSGAQDVRFFLDTSSRLITEREHVDEFRRTIRDLAVQGRLVPQIQPDESTSNRQVYRHEETLNSREEGDHFRHPHAWTTTTVGQLADMVTSGSRGWAEYYSDSGPSFIRAQNIRFGRLRLNDLAHVTLPAKKEGKRTQAGVGDILIVITGAGVTNPALVNVDLGEAYVSQHVGLVKLKTKAYAPWVLLCLMAPFGCRDELVARAYGSGKPGLNLDNIRTLVVPLPPLDEQQMILERVDLLMSVCDEMDWSLATAQVDRKRLLETLIHRTLNRGDIQPFASEPTSLAVQRAESSLAGSKVPPSRSR